MVISFENFLHFIANSDYTQLNVHFKPVSFFCSPCEINYDFISDEATLTDDILEFFKTGIELKSSEKIFVNELADNRSNMPVLMPYKTHKNAENEFYKIAERNKTLVQMVYEKYKWDFIIFNYDTVNYGLDNMPLNKLS